MALNPRADGSVDGKQDKCAEAQRQKDKIAHEHLP